MRLRIIIAVTLLFAECTALSAKEAVRYAASAIPPVLLEGAGAVVRTSSTEVEIQALKRVVIREHWAVTVLNAGGAQAAAFAEQHTPLSSIKEATGTVYDAAGKEVKKLRASDFIEMTPHQGYQEFTDLHVRLYRPAEYSYPFTVEYTVEREQSHTFFLPAWSPQVHPSVAVERATLQVLATEAFGLRYRLVGAQDSVHASRPDGHTYLWRAGMLRAYKPEPFEAAPVSPGIVLTTSRASLDDATGPVADWKEFGAFLYALGAGRATLSADDRKHAVALAAEGSTDREKVARIYAWMQAHMRYVSVQYGIGGWQPLPAETVARNGYGDCKALSNYTMAMLDAAGFPSYPVVVAAGETLEEEMPENFAANCFNHQMLCVPIGVDTMWLECTSQTLPAGYLSDFTQARRVLLLTPQGGRVARTPCYDTTVNLVHRTSRITLSPDGSLQVTIANRYTGDLAADLVARRAAVDARTWQEFVDKKFELPAYSVVSSAYAPDMAAAISTVQEDATLRIVGAVADGGARRMVKMDVQPLPQAIQPPLVAAKKRPFKFSTAVQYIDSLVLTVPEGWEVENMPANTEMQGAAGGFSSQSVATAEGVVLVRRFVRRMGVYAPAEYARYTALVQAARSGRAMQVVLRRKE